MFAWLIEQILNDLPVWLWPATAGAGAVVYFLSGLLGTFPTFKIYAKLIKPVSAIVVLLAVFMYGGSGVTALYQARVDQVKKEVEIAKQASTDANKKLATVRKVKQKIIHDRQIVIHERIREVEKQIDAECKVDPAAVNILNSAAKDPLTMNMKKGTVSVQVEPTK
jgi:hypothetical protein